MGNKIIALLGGACCGKDTIRNMMLENYDGFVEAKSYTTRPMRVTENGTEYYFTQLEDFNAMYDAGAFVETREYTVVDEEGRIDDVWYYGYTKDEIDSTLEKGNVLMIVDLQGFKDIKEMYPDCISFYLSLDKDVKIKRYLERDEINWKNVYEAVRRITDDEENAFVGVEKHVTHIISNPITSHCAMTEIIDFLVLNGIDIQQKQPTLTSEHDNEYYRVPSLMELKTLLPNLDITSTGSIMLDIPGGYHYLDKKEVDLIKDGSVIMKRIFITDEEQDCIHLTPLLDVDEKNYTFAPDEWICDMPLSLLQKVEVL